ncbi:hypothetical protein ES703_111614 [subsurface metagenome]
MGAPRPWLEGWGYRKSHEIDGSTVGAQTDYHVPIAVHRTTGTDSGGDVYVGTKCLADFGDIRFTTDDAVTLIVPWLEGYSGGVAYFWVKMDSLPDSPDAATIYVYYGKADATSASTESREDFTGYTEVEEIDDIQKTAYHVDFADRRDRTTYLYRDYTADHFSDFADHLNIKRVTHGTSSWLAHILMADVVKGQKQMRDDHDEMFYVAVGGTTPKITVYEWDSGGNHYYCDPELTGTLTLGTMYYLSLRKYGASLILDTYTTIAKRHAGGDGDFGHQTLTLTVDYSFRYNYAGNSHDSGHAYVGSSDLENLLFRKYVDPEPSNGAWGTEESA